MNRKEIYDFIKSNNLADEINKKFNKNYTNVKTEDLESFIKSKTMEQKEQDKFFEETYKKLEEISEWLKDFLNSLKNGE
jgi:F0F1-type ATP synthase delta subunit